MCTFKLASKLSLIIATSILICFIVLKIAKHNHPRPLDTPTQSQAYVAPTISYENRKPEGEKIDPNSISHENQGNYLDIDGDGTQDHLIMNGNTLYFAKGQGNNQYAPAIAVLVIKGDVMAYVVQAETGTDGKTRNVLRFWNSNRDGYKQVCLGLSGQGIPYFGEVESQ